MVGTADHVRLLSPESSASAWLIMRDQRKESEGIAVPRCAPVAVTQTGPVDRTA